MEDEIEKCYFVPKSSMKKALDFLENKLHMPNSNSRCKLNLMHLQTRRSAHIDVRLLLYWQKEYKMAISRAIYSHDWNKLLYLLQKSPIWEQNRVFDFYIRALTILLMNHPSAKSQGLLNEYLHMVLSCRTDEDKKAVLKAILTLQKKFAKVKIRINT